MLKITYEEFMKKAEHRYFMLEAAELHRQRIQYQIKLAKDAGFNVICLGAEVRVTIPKEKP